MDDEQGVQDESPHDLPHISTGHGSALERKTVLSRSKVASCACSSGGSMGTAASGKPTKALCRDFMGFFDVIYPLVKQKGDGKGLAWK